MMTMDFTGDQWSRSGTHRTHLKPRLEDFRCFRCYTIGHLATRAPLNSHTLSHINPPSFTGGPWSLFRVTFSIPNPRWADPMTDQMDGI
ncbi:hypothetical protein Mp_8g17570 [Marchantia polymorpha subsp. ruderalis]|uniref:Uncharacterized protein n=1 Tax=Marchantia polymorpha TaxID=3197 RepID=A0A2R6X8C4_MARPO|nr:hypothetical protein MARPO_0030s0091 [Marchantia polymorpha]BBN20237.1 hypothetical protein Mp_8g17570 [Marchantia polymorpha subsp. ruderalis]|eukprot:PTQ42355.1 hypothetical protein MARPO_0030s0091 [Marchantia polymorpha]